MKKTLIAISLTALVIFGAYYIITQSGVFNSNRLQITDIEVGTGTEAKHGNKVTVHYIGTLEDGKEFDSSKRHGKPFTFNLGLGQVIKGWDQGVLGMKVGGKRKLRIPSDLAYGKQGVPRLIPPDATLLFDVELLEVSQ